jgi:hypothetical protein
MSGGDRREAIYLDDADREEFLRALGEVCAKMGWQVHVYCVMTNDVKRTLPARGVSGSQTSPAQPSAADRHGSTKLFSASSRQDFR